MAVISGTEKEKLVELFIERGVKFYHACQWEDFKTYCLLGGVPSRNLMESNNRGFTKFDTDDRDKENEVWNSVFGNLIDSGSQFGFMGQNDTLRATPNHFGPILLIFDPSVFNYVDDVAIALRSAGGENFDREKESLSSVQDVKRLFTYQNLDDCKNDYQKAYIKWGEDLEEEFPDYGEVHNPEVSCTVKNELIPFEFLSKIIVDKIEVNKNYLPNHVFEKLKEFNINCHVDTRYYIAGREQILSDLIKASVESVDFPKNELSEDFNNWIIRIMGNDRSAFFFDRFVRYLESGTINVLSEEKKLEYGIFNLPPFDRL